ncbi:MAG: ABC transporter substrate-binding protein [Reyranellaceae bacterium]
MSLGLGSGLGATAARAKGAKPPTVGILGAGAPASWATGIAAFTERLAVLDRAAGRTVTVIQRWADGNPERYEPIARELVALGVDVIVTAGSAVPAALRATSTVPIVFAVAVDPLRSGFVASLARPGGNVTGLSLQSRDIVGKRVELIRRFVPELGRLAVLYNAGYAGAVGEADDVEAAAGPLGLATDRVPVRAAADIVPALESLRGRNRALYVCTESMIVANVAVINDTARRAGLATLWGAREFCAQGGFLSYGANEVDLFRRAADYVDRILKGARPADLPVEQPTRLELVVNLATARQLGLEIPPPLLALADDVLE